MCIGFLGESILSKLIPLFFVLVGLLCITQSGVIFEEDHSGVLFMVSVTSIGFRIGTFFR